MRNQDCVEEAMSLVRASAIDLDHLASQLERVLAEQDRIRAEIGGLRDDIRTVAATLLRIDRWIAEQSPPP
jgi:hypothetical protein